LALVHIVMLYMYINYLIMYNTYMYIIHVHVSLQAS